jgi:hypothetical protein
MVRAFAIKNGKAAGAHGSQCGHGFTQGLRSCRYACTLIFPLRIAIQVRYSLRRKAVEVEGGISGGDTEAQMNPLENLSPKFCYLIDNALFILFLNENANETVILNTTISFNSTRRAAARAKGAVAGAIEVGRRVVSNSVPSLPCNAGVEHSRCILLH